MQKVSFEQLKPGYDIIVVGVGAAGCSFVKHIDKKYAVLCIDYRKFPRFKACSGIVVSAGKDYFKGQNLPDEIFADKKPLDIKYLDLDNDLESSSKKGFYNTWRKNLDSWLLEDNKNSGVEFLTETKFVDFYYTADKKYLVILCEHDGIIKTFVCKYLIGCDGANSSIRQKISPKPIRYYVAIQEIIDHKFNDAAYFIFDSTITDFYAWVIPKGKKVEIGAALNPYRAKEKYEIFKKKIKERFKIKGDGKLESALLLRPKSFSDLTLGEGNVLLCGESGGLITPSAAEGISSALRSGKYCAESLNSNFDKNPLELYKKKSSDLLDRLKTKFKKSEIISDVEARKKLFKK